jgi:hypothetical protein
MEKQTVPNIINKLGADKIAKELGVSLHAVRYAKTVGSFPAAWFAVISDLCEDAKIDLPLDLFNWKGVA